ncbi:MAG: hypothetical protein ACRC5C_14655 [Bacilli bacterium]
MKQTTYDEHMSKKIQSLREFNEEQKRMLQKKKLKYEIERTDSDKKYHFILSLFFFVIGTYVSFTMLDLAMGGEFLILIFFISLYLTLSFIHFKVGVRSKRISDKLKEEFAHKFNTLDEN